MVQNHTIDALLATELRVGPVFDGWTFIRGLTPSTFLMLAGCAFVLATPRDAVAPGTTWRRLRRFGFFLLLGYALHIPVESVSQVPSMSAEAWQQFLMADVLQCIALSLAALQGIALVARSRGAFLTVAAGACLAVLALTPVTWQADTGAVPPVVRAYLSEGTGSLFPLFPWMAYVLFGGVMGELYTGWRRGGPAVEARSWLLWGAGFAALALAASRLPLHPFGPAAWQTISPTLFLIRVGLVMTLLAALTYLLRHHRSMSPVLAAISRESLLVYAAHLCVVYGSPWNAGLRQTFGASLALPAVLGIVAALLAGSVLLACYWRECKVRRPTAARAIRVGLAVVLAARLI